MGEWGLLTSQLEGVRQHSPLVGHLWLVVMLLFRILVLATVGGSVFQDEQEEFVCNTLQPGCRQTCYDRAFPVSHYRFWLFHILLLSVPPVLFLFHKSQGGEEAGGAAGEAGPPCALHGPACPCAPCALRPARPACPCAPCALRARRERRCYLLSVALRLLAELAFLGGQALLYGFRVAPHFACAGAPCPHTVDCFVSRPTEKTVFLLFYFAVGLLSALLSVAELGHLLWKGCWAAEGDHRCDKAHEEAPTLLLLPRPPGPDPCAPPAYGHGGGRSKAALAPARRDLSI